jgi:hypothetical protein
MSRSSANRLAGAALPVAIGAGIQVSGIGGTTAAIVAWSLVGAVLVYLAWDALRGVDDREEPVGETARNLGKELLTFAQGRHAQHRAGSARAFDADTMSLFHELFGDRVVWVIDKLRDTGRIGVREAQMLIAPSRPAGIEQLGRRLIELGYPEANR